MDRLFRSLLRRGLMASLLCASVCLAACAKGGATQNELQFSSNKIAKQTILIYMVGSDLETENGAASMDLEEIRTAGADTTVANIVVLTGGSLKWQSDISANANTTYRLDGERWDAVDRADAENMGDAQTLSAFLTESCEKYPAESYALILWDHGGGPIEGYGFDELYAYDHLTLPEMRQALQNSPFGLEKEKLSWVGFDACLMSSIELACTFADFADYMIASQEAVPNQGLNYSFILQAGAGLMNGEKASRSIIDAYADYYEGLNAQLTNSKKTITLSCLDLSATDAVEAAINRLSLQLDETMDNGGYSTIAKERSEARTFGRFTLGHNSDLIDLKMLAEQAPQKAEELSDALIQSLDQLVVYQRTNQEETCGVSIFFPYDNDDYLKMDTDRQFGWQDIYQELGFAPEYAAFLYQFSQTQTAAPLAEWTGNATPQIEWDDQSGQYYLQLTQEQVQNYDRAAFYILHHISGEEYILRFMSRDLTLDEQGRLYANYNNQAIYAINNVTGQSTMPLVYETERDGQTVRYQMPIFLSRVINAESFQYDYQFGELQVELNLNTGEATVVGAIPDKEDLEQKPRGKQEIRLEDWSTARFLSYGTYMTRGGDNRLLPFGDWESSGTSYFGDIPVKDGFTIQMLPLTGEQDELYCIITMQDTQGNQYTSALMPVTSGATESVVPETDARILPTASAAFSFGAEDTQKIMENDDLELRLIGLRHVEYSDEIQIILQARNKSSRDMTISVGIPSIDGWEMEGVSSFPSYLDPGETDTVTFGMQITHSELYSNLQDCGITLVKEILATLQYEVDGFGSTQIPLEIHTKFDPKPYYDNSYRLEQVAFPLASQTLCQGNGAAVRLVNAYMGDSSQNLYLEFELETGKTGVDEIWIDHFSFNGIMYDGLLYSPYHAESIGGNKRLRFTMPFSVLDLAYMGVTTIQDVGFSISLSGNAGKWESMTWHRLTPTGTASDETVQQRNKRLEGARVVWDRNGVRISQLAGYAAGTYSRTFFVENCTPFLISVESRDTKVNGLASNGIDFYAGAIAPGKSAFVSVTLQADQLEKEGVTDMTSSSFHLLVVKTIENGLLFVTNRIEVIF